MVERIFEGHISRDREFSCCDGEGLRSLHSYLALDLMFVVSNNVGLALRAAVQTLHAS